MNPVIGAALLSSAANIASNLFTNSSNSSNVDSANQAAVDLWREQSAYNTPKNQMSRAVAAGLNPNLVATNAATTGAAANAPQMLAKHTENPVQLDPLTAAQVDNIKADTELKRSQSNESESKVQVNASTIRLNDWTINMQQQLTPHQISLLQQSLQQSIKETDYIVQQAENLKVQYDILSEQKKQEIVRTSVAESTKDMQISITQQQLELLTQQVLWNPKIWQSVETLNYSTANLHKEQKREIQEKLDEWLSESAKNCRLAGYDFQKSYDEFRNVFSKLSETGYDDTQVFTVIGLILKALSGKLL